MTGDCHARYLWEPGGEIPPGHPTGGNWRYAGNHRLASTIRTVLRRLEEKGYVSHEVDGRTFIYKASDARQNVAVRAVKSIIDRFCGGSAEQLVLGMVDNAVLDRKQLERLARRIAEQNTEEITPRKKESKS